MAFRVQTQRFKETNRILQVKPQLILIQAKTYQRMNLTFLTVAFHKDIQYQLIHKREPYQQQARDFKKNSNANSHHH
jgi:hypothetical protein